MSKKVVFGVLLGFIMLKSEVAFSESSENMTHRYPKTTLIPRSVLLAKADRFCVSMNHAGNKIAYLARKGLEIELHIEDLSGNLLRTFPVRPSLGLFDGGLIWMHTDNHILIFQDENGNENDQIYCLDITTGKSRNLTPFSGSKSFVEKISKDHPHDVIIACNKNDPHFFDIYRVNIIDGKANLIFKNTEYVHFIFDSNLTLRIATKILPNGDEEHYRMLDDGPVLFKKVPFEDSKNSSLLHFRSDNKVLYGFDSSNRDTNALVEYNLENKTSKVLFEHNLADIDSGSIDPNTFAPQMVTVEYLNPDISVIDLKIFEDIKYLKSKLDESALKIVSRSNDDNRWLIISYSSFEPSKYYLYTRDSKSNTPVSLKCLFSTQPELDKYQLQKKNPIIIKSRDGLDLVCYLTKSCDFKEGTPSKMLIRVHGGPWGRDNICLNKEVQLFANRGYSVLQINYRGSIGFGKKFTNAANGNLHKIRNDIIDGVNWAIKNKIADKDKIGIIGASFGGYSVLAGLAFTPNVFCCGIDVVGPSNFMTILRTVPKYWKPRMISWYKLIGNPETKAGRSKLLSFSPITRVNSIKKPLMIFQGEHDPRVNRAESDQMVAAMKENGLPVVYVLYSNEGHGFHHEANSKTHQAFTEKFLAKVMGGWYEPIYQGELERSSHQILEGKNLVEN